MTSGFGYSFGPGYSHRWGSAPGLQPLNYHPSLFLQSLLPQQGEEGQQEEGKELQAQVHQTINQKPSLFFGSIPPQEIEEEEQVFKKELQAPRFRDRPAVRGVIGSERTDSSLETRVQGSQTSISLLQVDLCKIPVIRVKQIKQYEKLKQRSFITWVSASRLQGSGVKFKV